MQNTRRALPWLLAALLLIWSEAQAEPPYSGFLIGYPTLKPSDEVPGSLVWTHKDASLATFDRVLIAPIEIWIAPDSKHKGINPDELKVLTDTFRQVLIDRLAPDYPIAEAPGPGVLGLRLAITNVDMQNKKRTLLGYTPIGLVVTGVGNVSGTRASLAGAGIEAELYDSQDDRRLGVLVDPTVGDEAARAIAADEDDDTIEWETVKMTLDFYAQRLRANLDRDHER